MKAVLLAAGRGTRMGELTRDTPKPLLRVNAKPILAHIIDGMAAAGIREVVVVTGYLGEQIERTFGDGAGFGLSIVYRRQQRTDGTGGALLLARDLVAASPFMLSWGDIIVDPRFYRTMIDRFAAAPCDVLLGVNPVDDPWRGAAVYVDAEWRVQRIVEKPPPGTSATGWNNAGIFVFAPLVLEYAARLQPSARGEYELPQAIARMVHDGRDVRAVPVGDLWSDVGTPADLVVVGNALVGRGVPAPPSSDIAAPRVGEGARESDIAARRVSDGAPESDVVARRAEDGPPNVDEERISRLVAAFRDRFGFGPEAVVSAPGRVNLIGEHTDYNGLPVLPMAIDRSILMAVRRGGAEISLANLDHRFAPREYRVGADIAPFADGDWGNYHKAAVQGLVRHLQQRRIFWRGGAFLAEGDVPSGAGLSSSSAFVVASALAFLAANDIELPRVELAELLARAERYVGTLSGGMDQAASLLAEAGHAVRIDFFPLRVRPVPLPPGIAVVVCHSLVRAEKSAGARDAYNTRVVECRLACHAMERALAGSLPRPLARLGDLAEMFPGRPLASFVGAITALVPGGGLSLAEVARALGVAVDELRRRCEIPSGMADRFAVLPRARHVLGEADRVARGVEALASGEVAEFGGLMRASHASCRDDFEVSCPALDDLVEIALRAGALGARLTGAGFGGCTVNLVRRIEVEPFLAAVDRDFYGPRLAPGEDPAGHRFLLSAREGAIVRKP